MALIIFDLDGTIVDSIGDITLSLNYALKPFGFKQFSDKEVRQMVGGGISKLIESVLGDKNQSFNAEALSRFLEYYWDNISVKSIIFPGVKETLAKLSGFRKVILSNKREAFSKKLLNQIDLDHYFELIYGSDSVPKKKPAPDAVNKVLSELSIKQSDAIIVGDSEIDVMAGKNAGIKTVGVTYGYRDKETLLDADFILDDIRGLPRLIESLEW